MSSTSVTKKDTSGQNATLNEDLHQITEFDTSRMLHNFSHEQPSYPRIPAALHRGTLTNSNRNRS
jgi:hypothetical protein